MTLKLFSFFGALLVGAPLLYSSEAILEDSPTQFGLRVETSGFKVESSLGGSKIVADDRSAATLTGSPDLPYYRFQIATGAKSPAVTVEVEEWEDLAIPQGLAGVPFWKTNREPLASRDDALFLAAGQINPVISEPGTYRGITLRTISIPLGLPTPDGKRVRLIRRFTVRVHLAAAQGPFNSQIQTQLKAVGIKNILGGSFFPLKPSAPLPKGKGRIIGANLGNSWIKIKVGDKQVDGLAEDGVYAIPFETAVATNRDILGAKISSLRIYAGPKDTLNSTVDSLGTLPPTLAEIPITVEDANSNGTFDEGDRLVFYGHGTSLWNRVPKDIWGSGIDDTLIPPAQWQFVSDPYSFENGYFLDWSGSGLKPALRNTLIPSGPIPAKEFSVAPHYLRAEKDLSTGSCAFGQFDGETGFDWYWHGKEDCSSIPSMNLNAGQLKSPTTDTLDGYMGDTTYIGFFVSEMGSAGIFQAFDGFGTLPQLGKPLAKYGTWFAQPTILPPGSLGFDSVRWDGSNRKFEGYTIKYSRKIDWKGKGRLVFPTAWGERIRYRIQDGSGLNCLRVEKGVGRNRLEVKSLGTDGFFVDSAGLYEDVLYYLYQSPVEISKASLQEEKLILSSTGLVRDLFTGDGVDPEYMIISPEALLPQAIELSKYRNESGRIVPLKTVVVRVEDIYRNWSGGRLSPPAIRDFLGWALNHWGGATPGRLKYTLLFGDGHYDYRDILKSKRPNYIPPFNRDQGDDPMSTDDFYAVLDAGENWETGLLDLSLGRLSVQSSEDAVAYLEKIKLYESPKSGGEWRSRTLHAADDDMQRGSADGVLDHTNDTEKLTRRILAQEPGMRVEKIYELDYPFNASLLKPEATQDLITTINRGVLALTFVGHGAYDQWADEVLLKTNDAISRFRNNGTPFAMAVFSCTVGRFDKILDDGMCEKFVRQKNFGAIAALGGSRETYPGPNIALGESFLGKLFSKTMGQSPAIGEAVLFAKNQTSARRNNQKYILFGEPVVMIRRPELSFTFDKLPDTLRALECGVVSGKIAGGSGKGSINLRILSGDVKKNYVVKNDTAPQRTERRGQILFERTVPYANHSFAADFFLPKQLPFGDSLAKIQIFAWDAEKPMEGSTILDSLSIQNNLEGSVCTQDDSKGPRIKITGCNIKESGGVDFPDRVKITLPYCLQIEVTDSTGGVMSGEGPDEGTTFEWMGVGEPFHPKATSDELYRKTYPFTMARSDAQPGNYAFKVNARDGFGNLGSRLIHLEITNDSVIHFVNAFNVPNPVKNGGTTFYFSTTIPVEEGEQQVSPRDDRILYDLKIFNQKGYLVQEFRDIRSGDVHWNGVDAWGRSLANGIYFYQAIAKWDFKDGSPGKGQRVSRRNTLVLSR